MVQLRVEDGVNIYFLDLYKEDPIKLTLSIEDITNTEARSTFSRTFRVPATGNNNQFFKHAFRVDGFDYDVTVKKPAQILSSGNLYKEGHIRLQKIYVNGQQNQIDYEIVFLGETRDFASAVGEKMLSDLDLSGYNHALSYANITQSWQAWPEGAENDGLFNGDILYPLISFGIEEGDSRIAYSSNSGSNTFDKTGNAIYPNRFKPMIRAKALWDKIFEEAGFTYTSQIADSNEFRQLYISAFGNEATTNEDAGSANRLDVSLFSDFDFSDGDIVEWRKENLDPNDNYSTTTFKYTVPVTGTYEVNASVNGAYDVDGPGTALVRTKLMRNTTVLDDQSSSQSNPVLNTYNFSHYVTFNGSLTAGDEIYIEMEYQGATNRAQIESDSSYFEIPHAAGPVNIATQLDDNYKQIDFIKDMITKFRLVMAPDKNNPKNFIVEPWSDYIATGQVFDWSDKLANDKDIQIQPLFFTQSARIEFTDKADADFLNELNIKQFKETFGTLYFDAQNELLKGTRKITTNFAPTPMRQIEGASDSNFLIPLIHSHDSDDDVTQHNPIKAVTRILFYNGLFTQEGFIDDGSNPPAITDWYFFDDNNVSQAQSQFPMVSYWQNFDPVTGPNGQTVNLNWQIERGYAADYANFNYNAGVSMFTRFWSDYIESLYDKDARRITAYFNLSAEDLFDFSFDDVIFLNGNYYRPEKVQDVIVGEKALVKVQLIKLLDYTKEAAPPLDPCDFADPLTAQISSTDETTPGADDGTITVTPQGGVGPYSIIVSGTQQISNGEAVTFTNLANGNYLVSMTDSCGTQYTEWVAINAAPQPGNYYNIQLCTNPGDIFVASYSPGGLTPGQSVTTTLDGGANCYEILSTAQGPAQTTILGVYQDCAACGSR